MHVRESITSIWNADDAVHEYSFFFHNNDGIMVGMGYEQWCSEFSIMNMVIASFLSHMSQEYGINAVCGEVSVAYGSDEEYRERVDMYGGKKEAHCGPSPNVWRGYYSR